MMAAVTGLSSIAFYRPPAVWRDRLRAYRLVVDGYEVGEIRRGQVLRVQVSPGRHEVQARIDWTGSKRWVFDAVEGCEARFRVEPAGNSLMFWQAFGSEDWLRMSFDGMTPGSV
ncbi:hypothetical protein GCM10009661_18720 [Catellatospora chokoriensis]|uniref:Uncharacterized protein n=1 Tax=Catellatospora chokoriensis TaxID=310353 RepID=A0A8J3JWY8_9ACTN|nr:hypothetical protein Cch02nite_61010 [Catellatospora chokoriensis]